MTLATRQEDDFPESCPLCGTTLKVEVRTDFEAKETLYVCSNCGSFSISRALSLDLAHRLAESRANSALLSHLVRRMQRMDEPVGLTRALVSELLAEHQMPSPAEQADNLLRWLGDQPVTPGEDLELTPETHRAIMGAWNRENFRYVLEELRTRALLKVRWGTPYATVSLTFAGWQRHRELCRGSTHSRRAFMAMPFGSSDLDRVFRACFKPAARATGYDLVRADEGTPAGSIDDRIRVAILTARFVVADLTRENRGVYWEAGFAEGLGKPVIYTCEGDWFEQHGTHFDTNHKHTVIWRDSELGVAASSLKATIRATLPEDAVLEDE